MNRIVMHNQKLKKCLFLDLNIYLFEKNPHWTCKKIKLPNLSIFFRSKNSTLFPKYCHWMWLCKLSYPPLYWILQHNKFLLLLSIRSCSNIWWNKQCGSIANKSMRITNSTGYKFNWKCHVHIFFKWWFIFLFRIFCYLLLLCSSINNSFCSSFQFQFHFIYSPFDWF